MRRKQADLRLQMHAQVKRKSDLFAGLSIAVNGYTSVFFSSFFLLFFPQKLPLKGFKNVIFFPIFKY
jgi:hypothetical protein